MVSAMMLISYGVLAQYTIRGKVVSQEDGMALEGATVVLETLNRGAIANEAGEFEFRDVAVGTYVIQVSHVGYRPYKEQVNVRGNVVDLMIRMKIGEKLLNEVVVMATRASEKTPTTFTNVSAEEIQKQNFGQDLPFLLNWTPSAVVTSDAGTGIGYTGIRIRGSDPTRINVTINGVPLNDSESQGVFWVNMPDFASSVDNVQIQRGVGTSTNGAGAFGASVNLLTNGLKTTPEAQLNTSFGSFNTQKYTAIYHTGLIDGKWAFEGRLSRITSDGYIDRAFSDLKSYYLSGGYFGKKTIARFITFSGKEVTYQSWWGVPEAKLKGDREGIDAVISNNGYTPEQAENLRNSGRTFNYYLYDNQVDDYGQDHYQMHFSHQFDQMWSINGALHYTDGAGFFEEFKEDEGLQDYGLDNLTLGDTTIASSDLIRRRWLDNDFYGLTYNLRYERASLNAILGGAANKYEGNHFGEVIWTQFASNSNIRHRYYESDADKSDFNVFFKLDYQVGRRLNLFGDFQWRKVGYKGNGTDNDLRTIDFDREYSFFNPKFGASYQLNNTANVYVSFAMGNKEPNRADIIDAVPGTSPKHEQLSNVEAGYRYVGDVYHLSVNYYWMDYKDQLVLTGEVNDVGAGIRTNVEDSYRTGIELQGGIRLKEWLRWNANAAFSINKVAAFEELIADYGSGGFVRTPFRDTDISFSPSVVAGSQLTVVPAKGLGVSLLSKYVGDQFLDNTSDEDRKIDAFFVNDVRVNYAFQPKFLKAASLSLLVNNIFDTSYESNGYTFGYFLGADTEVRENYFFPQAGTNFLISLQLVF